MLKQRSPRFLTLLLAGSLTCLVFFFVFILSFNFPAVGDQQTEAERLTNKRITSADLSSGYLYTERHERPPIVEIPPEPTQMQFQTLLDVVTEWNPDTPEPPASFKETLQNFDYGNPVERELAIRYREAEVPFKIHNISEVNEVAKLWSDDYLLENLPKMAGRAHVERSKNNHFMFWSTRGGLRGKDKFIPPTEIVRDMSFAKWLQLAKEADATKLSNDSTHYYFMTGAEAHENGRTFISRDLKFLSTNKNNFFITNVKANKGIQCRFGMRGIIAESHYDSGKNMVVMLRGKKRYIINPPRACKYLGIISDKRHPSFRHSVIDWSDVNQARSHEFDKAEAIDTIVNTGEVLYIPSFWFHYIISLDYSIQCNSRSGFPASMYGQYDINECYKGAK